MKPFLRDASACRFPEFFAASTVSLLSRSALGGAVLAACAFDVHAQQAEQQLQEVVVSASRAEQERFDAPAAIDVIQVDPFAQQSPLVNMSELLSGVPGLQVRERQNYAQDLQISVRGFGTRSTFGVRGVRILIDGIPATMPDGQGQAATASLASASRIEVLRGPLAQLYGNAAGGVVQVFSKDPPLQPQGELSLGAGSDGQRQYGFSLGGGSETLGAVLDVSQYATDGYRDHSAARRTTVNGKVVARPSADTTITGVFSSFDQPLSQDPLGLTRAAFMNDPRSVAPNALTFDTRKTISQTQLGVVVEHKLGAQDTLNARVYGGERQVFQTLGFAGGPTSAGGVIDLDRGYGGAGASWTHRQTVNGLPLQWTLGADFDTQSERRQGFDNAFGTPTTLRRDERGRARNRDLYAQVDWTFAPQWRLIGGVRSSEVRLEVDDDFIAPGNPDDSGRVKYRATSPVAGLLWNASERVNLYANVGKGFETPTLAEAAYRAGGTGPNLDLEASTSVQGEIGARIKGERHALDLALFQSRSKNEIVPQQTVGGRSVFQNVDGVRRRGVEAAWRAEWDARWSSQLAYTWLDAQFRRAFSNAGGTVTAGNRLPGAAEHSLYGELQYRWNEKLSSALEMSASSRTWVNDVNSEAAPGYAVVNLRGGYRFDAGPAKMILFGRIDNVFDRAYAGSVIVNDGNGRFYEPAPGRRLFVGLRTAF